MIPYLDSEENILILHFLPLKAAISFYFGEKVTDWDGRNQLSYIQDIKPEFCLGIHKIYDEDE